jgi:hypothetical protein
VKRFQLTIALLTLCAGLYFAQPSHAHGGVRWSIGLNFGYPGFYGGYYHRPWYGPGPYYAPYPYYYEPAPVIIRPAPVVIQQPATVVMPAPAIPAQAPVAAPAPVAQTPPAPVVRATSETPTSSRVESLLSKLTDSNEATRRDAAMDLGRAKAQKAIEPLINVLTKDSSPIARDAAARALGLIGSQRGMNALIYAAQADNDRDVRHSAQFAVEVIRTNLRGN